MQFPGFCGKSYRSQSPFANIERTVNFYPEIQEVPSSKARIVLAPTPGLALFATAGNGPVRGSFEQNGRAFCVSGDKFYEVFGNGTVTEIGTVGNDGLPATIDSNGVQLFITSGGNGYIYTFATSAFTQIVAAGFPGASMGAFLDGYFIALKPDSRQINVSALYDGLTWNASESTVLSQSTDNIRSMIVDHRQLWLFGGQKTHVYENVGNPNFPFEPTLSPGSQVEHGIAAAFSLARLDNTVFFLGSDERGAGIVWRLEGYIPRRISDHGVEFAFQGYSRIDDAIAWTYQDKGHMFYVLYFPTADKTWVYDIAADAWHERTWFGGTPNQEHAHRGRCHFFAFWHHLVGDRENGKIYRMSSDLLDDDGQLIRRIRQAPHLSNEQKWIYYKMLQLDLQAGIGLDGIAPPTPPAPDPVGYNPKVILQYSDDSGNTWSPERAVSAGKLGEYRAQVQWYRLGRARDRVFRIIVTDPVHWTIIQAFLDFKLGIS